MSDWSDCYIHTENIMNQAYSANIFTSVIRRTQDLCQYDKLLCLLLLLIGFIPSTHSEIRVSINPEKTYQIIDGFGASDCWTVNYVGKYWADTEKEKAAKWLFSSNLDSTGNPTGIGLSIWRFNLGAGTVEQGDSSHISDITRRAECFMDNQGRYDWSKQAGQQWFLNRAKKYGCNSFVAFSNSPPVFFTRNGHGFGTAENQSNLRPDKFDSFADYLVQVSMYFAKEKGIQFEYISPMNEPQWKWDGTYQEGSTWRNDEIKKMVVSLDKAISKNKLESKILFTESATWSHLYKERGNASNQIYQFYDKSSTNYIGDLQTVNPVIGGHSYWTDTFNKTIKSVRDSIYRKASKYHLKTYQTEWSLLSKLPLQQFPKSYSEATYTDIALYMAKIIYADLAYARVSSWSFWTSMDVEMWGFKNRFNLIRLHSKGDSTSTIASGGTVSATKSLWVLGNYSLFIRPGYRRIHVSGADNLSKLMGLSFISPDQKEIVTVLTNISNEKMDVCLALPKTIASRVKKINRYLTDEDSDLKFKDISNNRTLLLPKKSVTTVVYKLL